MSKHPLGIPQITLDDHIKEQSYQRMLIWAQEKANTDALTRKAFNHGLYGKEYNHRENKHVDEKTSE